MNQKQTRVPRPQGVTYLATEYNKNQDNQAYKNLIQHIITQYALNGFRYQGTSLSIPELAYTLKVSQTDIIEGISLVGRNISNFEDPEATKDTLKSIVALSTNFALQDRGLIATQLETLLTSQDGKYKPFITSEVNKNLKLMLESNKNLMDVYKTFFTDQSSTNTIINVQGTNNEDNRDYLTPDQALDMITNSSDQGQLPIPLSESERESGNAEYNAVNSSVNSLNPQADELYRKHGIGGLCEVKEIRTGTEALRAPEAMNQGPKAAKPIKAVEPSGHENPFERRGIEVEDVDELPDS